MIINFDLCSSFKQVHRSAISIHVSERKHIKRTKSLASSFFLYEQITGCHFRPKCSSTNRIEPSFLMQNVKSLSNCLIDDAICRYK